MKYSPEEIAHGLGVAPPPKTEPANRIAAAADKVRELDGKLDKMALADQRPGESEAAAHARFHESNPSAYGVYKKAKALILKAHGVDDSACGGV
jgi:hypothetical protein